MRPLRKPNRSWVYEMRELWVDLSESQMADLEEGFLKKCLDLCNVLVVSSDQIDVARSTGARRIASIGAADIVLVPVSDVERIRELKKLGMTVGASITVESREDLNKIEPDTAFDYLVVDCPNWRIIPTENLIALGVGKWKLIVKIKDPSEARSLLETLELGADGVLLNTRETGDLESLSETIRTTVTRKEEIESSVQLPLVTARVVEIRELGIGARVCVDTCSLMRKGEGMLVGSQSLGLFLIQAEVEENPHVASRPFRVNAGPVSSYIAVSPEKTQYLSELRGGDELMAVDREGRTRKVTAGRIKIENRPFTLFKCEYKGITLKSIVQNAETVRYVTKDGSKAIPDVKEGDELLVWVSEGGRHFGTLVEPETVLEY